MVSVEDYEEQLAKAGEFHGEICGGNSMERFAVGLPSEPSLQCTVWN